MRKRTKEEVFKAITEKSGDVFDFSNAVYTNTHGKIETTCKICGYKWTPIVESLLNGCGCPQCAAQKRGMKSRIIWDKEGLIEQIKQRLRIKIDYDYSLIPNGTYSLHSDNEVDIICPKHSKFHTTVKKLLSGTGCDKCYIDNQKEVNKLPEVEFYNKLQILNPSLEYDRSSYINTQTDLNFKCKICGTEFPRSPNSIIYNSCKCPSCSRKKIVQDRTKTTEQYIEDVHKVWGNKYGTDHIVYKGSNQIVTPTCPEHGDFPIEANSFLQGHGCPFHFTIYSKAEKEILSFIRHECGYENAHSDRKMLGHRNEIDILIDEKKIGFEYDGLFWHSELKKDKSFHLNKTQKCAENGITLYHIFEDEWIHKTAIVKSMIKSILGVTDNRIFARKCEIKEISSPECSCFLEENHIQGNCLGRIRIGLFYHNELVSVMLMGHSRHFAGSGKEEWELLRMCSKINTTVVGGASKMFRYFIKYYSPKSIITFADKRWSIGNVYYKLGFQKYNESKPNYFYIIGDKRYYRYNFRKEILIKKYNCPPNMTEKEFCFKQKWYRIYDCGCLCFKWENPDSH